MAAPRITYTISLLQPHTHLYDIQIDVDTQAADAVEFIMPSWTPGSYMIREYARNVQEFHAKANGHSCTWHKTAKDAWQVVTAGAEQLTVHYRVYANELTVRTSHLDDSHGYFNGGSVFMYVNGRSVEPLTLRVITPAGWQVTTGLEPLLQDVHQAAPVQAPAAVATHLFMAADYDELVDCPVECGTHRLLTFTVDGREHRIAIWGHGNEDTARIVADSQRIVEVQRDLFGSLPYGHYTFLLHLTDGRAGGLEHRNSASNMVDRWIFQPSKSYERFLSLTSHEFFHVWNVKRIRPAVLGPFDYRRENYTHLLWIAEGITSYYDDLFLRRAELLTPERYLERVAEKIVTLQSQPGRHLQSLAQSSFDAWIKLYRPDENSANSSISYYLKGSLVMLLLDLLLLQRTGARCSLDDVMRALYARYGGDTVASIYAGSGLAEEDEFFSVVEAVAGTAAGSFRSFYEQYIAGTAELPYDDVFAAAGLRLAWGYRDNGATTAPAWLGLSTRTERGRLVVATVRADGPAYAAGINTGDELLALNGWRIDEAGLAARLRERRAGDLVQLTFFRGSRLRQLDVVTVRAPFDQLQIIPVAEPTAAQRQILQRWLAQ